MSARAGNGHDDRPRRLTTQGEDRRAAIVDNAERLFAEHGYDRTRMTDIATAAGVTKGLLYWYFENKQELIAEILASTRRRLRVHQQQAVGDLDDPLARLYVGTAASVRFVLDNYRLYLVAGDGPDRTLNAILGESSQVHASDTARTIADGQERGVVPAFASPRALAFANAGVVNSLCAAAFYGGLREPPEEVARTAAGYVLRALAADPAAVAEVESAHAHRLA
ncbi:MAG: TetR family transcriptional regulator [Actinomycetota bacterium]|nr:TetR family transcriptional regulator [Actinomycetota bacterium]